METFCHSDRSGEYGVRGRRRMDCIARLVKRASVSGERESNLLLFASGSSLRSRAVIPRDRETPLDMTKNPFALTTCTLVIQRQLSNRRLA